MSGFGVEINSDRTIGYLDSRQELSGCHAYVGTVGQIRDRGTLTRVVGGATVAGPIGAIVESILRSQMDERESFLLITGERDEQSSRPVDEDF